MNILHENGQLIIVHTSGKRTTLDNEIGDTMARQFSDAIESIGIEFPFITIGSLIILTKNLLSDVIEEDLLEVTMSLSRACFLAHPTGMHIQKTIIEKVEDRQQKIKEEVSQFLSLHNNVYLQALKEEPCHKCETKGKCFIEALKSIIFTADKVNEDINMLMQNSDKHTEKGCDITSILENLNIDSDWRNK